MSQSDSGSGSPNITPSIDLLFPSNRSPPESSVSNETFSQFSPSIDLLFPANRSEPESSVSNETFSQFSPSIDLLFPANRSEPESSVSNETFSQFSSSIQTFFPPYRSPPESSVSNVTFSQFYPSIDLLFPANRSEPESSVSNEALQQLLSIPLIFPPTKSQSQTNSSENDNRIPNLFIDSIFPPTRSDSDSFTHKYTTALSITSYFPPLKLSSHDEATSLWWITGEREVSKREQPMSSSGPANSSGFTFTEANSVRASTSKVICCHFSSDGKVLASAGQDNKAVLWDTYSLKPKASLREHSALITDVRFSPGMPLLATSSLDGTVRVWDSDNPGYSYSLRTFTGHSNFVMSVDFHPNKDDLICSRDYNGEIRYWSFNNGSCVRVLKGGTDQMGFQIRFQPRLGRYLAVAEENVVSILDVETGQPCRHSLQGHTKPIHSVCWDPTGDFLASISEDSARVWQVGSGEGDCIHELICNGDQFHSCVFHPIYSSLLIIGCCQSLELWNISNNKTMTLPAHEGLVAALAVSTVTGLVASASYDKFVKLWK